MIDKWTIKRGFTLIELIIVIAILGILVLLAAPNFLGKTQDAEHVKIMADSKNIEDASVLYHLENEDWPRLTDDPYTADELKLFASDFSDKTGKEITLDPNGSYYNIDYDELSQYIKAPDNKKDYILQNPVGKIFHMENLTEAGENRVDYDTEADESEDPVEETLYEFTTAGATGRLGPTQEDLDKAYKDSQVEGKVTSKSGTQLWSVPKSGTYKIEARGAKGGGLGGGEGAIISSELILHKDEVIQILVGQEGSSKQGEPNVASGGGGTFVIRAPYNNNDSILAIAGGGGGSPANYSNGKHASITEAGKSGLGLSTSSGGGSNGQGGQTSSRATGGGGFFSDGISTPSYGSGGFSFKNGGFGATLLYSGGGAVGGFGGGGHSMLTGYRGAGGGGGYSGGGTGSVYENSNKISGGGGGSYNSGENQENSVGNAGPGKVIITYLGK